MIVTLPCDCYFPHELINIILMKLINLSVTQRLGTPPNVHALSMFIWKPEAMMSLSSKGLLTLLSSFMIPPAIWNPGFPIPGMITFPEIIYTGATSFFVEKRTMESNQRFYASQGTISK